MCRDVTLSNKKKGKKTVIPQTFNKLNTNNKTHKLTHTVYNVYYFDINILLVSLNII